MDPFRWPVLGYDARERWCPWTRLFPRERVRTFLLRGKLEKALSADVMVWPTVFEDPDVAHLDLEDLALGARGVERPAWTGGLQGLWPVLEGLETRLASLEEPLPGPCDVVAFSAPSRPPHAPGPALPDRLDEGWRFLGYDVVDGWLLSGLTNCGYRAGEVGALRERWGPRLNRWHLFDDADDADAFRKLRDDRVVEHAPFMVCALFARDPAGPAAWDADRG